MKIKCSLQAFLCLQNTIYIAGHFFEGIVKFREFLRINLESLKLLPRNLKPAGCTLYWSSVSSTEIKKCGKTYIHVQSN